MKRLLLLVMLLCLLVLPVAATSIDFQEPTDNTSSITSTRAPLHLPASPVTIGRMWVGNASGGNSYEGVYALGCAGDCWHAYVITLPSVSQTGYAASTFLIDNTDASSSGFVYLIDASGEELYKFGSEAALGGVLTAGKRYEVSISGSTAYFYEDGILKANSTPLAQNPSYIGFGTVPRRGLSTGGGGWTYWDDYVYGAVEDKTVVDMPAANAYYLKKDWLNPAASGFYNASTDAVIYSTVMPVSYARSNISGIATNQTISLIHRGTSTSQGQMFTGNATNARLSWDINTDLFSTSAPYGFYNVNLGTAYGASDIAYIAGGATVSWDSETYATGDLATITYLVEPDYWDADYNYAILIEDAYGNDVDSTPIVANSGSVTYTWTEDEAAGVYYAEIVATPEAGGTAVLLNYDWATLSSSFKVYGYVHDAETTLPVSGAVVNASQGSTLVNNTTSAAGYYEVSGFITGNLFGMNTSHASYQTYWNNFTPLYNHALYINVTLIPNAHTLGGITLGGVARDTTYGRPIQSVNVSIWNVTDSQYWYADTNRVGFYNKTSMTENNDYSVQGMKTGYDNSTIYHKVVVAS